MNSENRQHCQRHRYFPASVTSPWRGFDSLKSQKPPNSDIASHHKVEALSSNLRKWCGLLWNPVALLRFTVSIFLFRTRWLCLSCSRAETASPTPTFVNLWLSVLQNCWQNEEFDELRYWNCYTTKIWWTVQTLCQSADMLDKCIDLWLCFLFLMKYYLQILEAELRKGDPLLQVLRSNPQSMNDFPLTIFIITTAHRV